MIILALFSLQKIAKCVIHNTYICIMSKEEVFIEGNLDVVSHIVSPEEGTIRLKIEYSLFHRFQ